jgi:hypothetical protein
VLDFVLFVVRAKKRMEQIENRKDREAKKSQYLEEIQRHSLTPEEQLLMTSTKMIGQTLSLKQVLIEIKPSNLTIV